MQKAKVYNIADSNIANLGTELEKKVKLAAAETEQAWKGVGKQVGLDIWRINQFKVTQVPKNAYGQFYSGDSYIVLWTYKQNDRLAWDVHFWLGTYTTQDEAGTAAYKTVELDDVLGGAPVQHREVQGYESQRFLSYFPNGIRILEGGFDTGFHHVKPEEYRPRLLHLKGKKFIRVSEVPLSHKSLNSGDVFIVDLGAELIQFNGSKSGVAERAKAAALVQAIEGERNGKSKGRVVEESEDDAAFWKALGGKGAIASAEAGGSDVEADSIANVEKTLHRLSDATGNMKLAEVAKGKKIKKSLLDSTDVFIIDAGQEVIAWVGAKASVGERKYALRYAQEFVTQHNKNPATPVSRVLEGGENEVWNSLFE
uniref:Fragmin A n=1 Tax=Physarum polycephalum TaxID=5791 RepID=Q9XZD2_PHYPO|nr:fragmin A [Physarum polycephalum]|eukprot:Phypoly_transcript_10975.p1 GENE.Phypoly_transcript_10975~~Phypoly_transcript_10975.p1  ORF type:complete len:369 (+),score=83.58 Phypoly_transcript_10975:75-1181(+)